MVKYIKVFDIKYIMVTKRPPKKHLKRTRLPKHIKPTTEGTCPICKKHVKSLEHHMKFKHRNRK